MGRSARSSSLCTCFRLRSLTRRVTQLYDQALAPSGLTGTQYSLLAHARRNDGPLTMGELAQLLFTDRTTLTRNLRPLADAGLVKVAGGADARSKAVVVTKKGGDSLRAPRPLWQEAPGCMCSPAGTKRLPPLHPPIGGILDAVLPPAALGPRPGGGGVLAWCSPVPLSRGR